MRPAQPTGRLHTARCIVAGGSDNTALDTALAERGS